MLHLCLRSSVNHFLTAFPFLRKEQFPPKTGLHSQLCISASLLLVALLDLLTTRAPVNQWLDN